MDNIIDQEKESVNSKYLIISLISMITLRKIKKLEAKRRKLQNELYKVYNQSKND